MSYVAQPRDCHLGMRGRDVTAYQRALKAAKIRLVAPTGIYGRNTRRNVLAFQQHHGLVADGIIGANTYKHLYPLFDGFSLYLLRTTKVPDDRRTKIVATAMHGVSDAPAIHYAQNRPIPHAYKLPMYTDCSGFATLCYELAGAPDPNNFAYDGWGYTGTMLNHGSWVNVGQCKPGDLVFYGNPVNHVAIFVGSGIGGGRVVSMGSEAAPFLLSVYYRSDLNQARRYFD